MSEDWISFFLDNGASIIPLKCKEKKPAIKWKKYTEEKLSKDEIDNVLAKEGSANYAVVCGEISNNLLVIDVDNAELFEKLNLGELATQTLTIKTAKGYHFYLRIDDLAVNKWIGEKGAKTLYYPPVRKGYKDESKEEIRFQWSEHYVVGPSSTHPSGTKYEALATSPKEIKKAKSIGLLEEIELRWKSYHKIKGRSDKILKKDLLEFIKQHIKVDDEIDCGDHVKIRCPFHKDVSPSLAVYKDNHWYCYGCEAGGRHVEFLMKFKKISKEDALSELGIPQIKKKEGLFLSKLSLDDGRYAEEILIDGEEQFVIYDQTNDSWEYKKELKNNGDVVFPIPLVENQRESLTLADGVEEYGTLRELCEEMLQFGLDEFDPVDNKELFELMVHMELISWIAPERMAKMGERFIPILAIRGPSETGKKRFLTIGRWLTYRSMYVLKTTKIPTLFRTIAPWMGTLILDEADLADSSERSEFIEFMNSRADGVPIPRYNAGAKEVEFFHSFGVSMVAERSSSVDDGYESRKMIFPSDSTTRPENYSLLPPKAWIERGKSLQRKLLLFRLRHLNGNVPTNLIVPGIKGFRVRESLLLIQSLADEYPEIISNIEKIAKKLEERIILERSGSMEGLILNLIYNNFIDEKTRISRYRDGIEIIFSGENQTSGDAYSYPMTLKTVSKFMGDVMSSSEVARRWRGLGQGVRPRGRISGRLYSGIIQVINTKRFIKEIGKYVVDVDYEELNSRLAIQKTFERDDE